MADSSNAAPEQVDNNGKGKAAAAQQETAGMDVDDSSSDDEIDEVCHIISPCQLLPASSV